MRNKMFVIVALCVTPTPAFAGEPCRTAKDLVNVAQNFYGDNPELTNIISPQFDLALKGINGAENPTAMLYRYEGEEHILPIVDGKMVGFEKAANWSKDGEMCRMVDGELAPVTEGDSVEANMNFSFPYKRTDGLFSIDEIKEGAKDGSKVMSGLAPGGLGFVVPGLKAIDLRPVTSNDPVPKFEFTRKGKPVDVASYAYGKQRLIRLKDIKSSKADTLTITGTYRLAARFKFDPDDIMKAEAKRLAEDSKSEH